MNKKIGIWACTALVVGNMIGSGVFLLPSALAPYGSVSILGWIATALGAISLALVFGRLARMYARTGGPYAWSRDGFGEFAGFLVAWGYWIATWAGNAAIAVAFAGYLSFFFPIVSENKLVGLSVALSAIWAVTLVNLRGSRSAGNLQVVTTILKILPLILIVGLGSVYFEPANFVPLNPSGQSMMSGVAACAALTLWAFIGLESATVPAGDVANPQKTIPMATVVGVVITAVLYIMVTVAVFGLIPPAQLANSAAPLADAALAVTGNWGGIVIAVGACISTFGTLNGFTLLAGQVPLGAAEDGIFPAWFRKRNKQGAPNRGLIVSSILASLIVSMNFTKGLVDQFTFVILLATLTTLVPYIFCALAEVMIYLKGHRKGERLSPIAFILGSFAFAYSLWAIYGAGQDIVFYGFLLLLAGIPIHVAIRWSSRLETNATTSPPTTI